MYGMNLVATTPDTTATETSSRLKNTFTFSVDAATRYSKVRGPFAKINVGMSSYEMEAELDPIVMMKINSNDSFGDELIL